MVNVFADEKYATREPCENRLSQFLFDREKGFYESGVIALFNLIGSFYYLFILLIIFE